MKARCGSQLQQRKSPDRFQSGLIFIGGDGGSRTRVRRRL